MMEHSGRSNQQPRTDRVMYLEGRSAVVSLLLTMGQLFETADGAAQVFRQLRESALCRPRSYAAGVESVICEIEEWLQGRT